MQITALILHSELSFHLFNFLFTSTKLFIAILRSQNYQNFEHKAFYVRDKNFTVIFTSTCKQISLSTGNYTKFHKKKKLHGANESDHEQVRAHRCRESARLSNLCRRHETVVKYLLCSWRRHFTSGKKVLHNIS